MFREDTHDVIKLGRNGSISDEMLFRSFESSKEKNIENLKYLRRMGRVCDQENTMICQFLQHLIGSMACAVVTKQNCVLSWHPESCRLLSTVGMKTLRI
jgi:hypothetical protein